MDGDPFPTSTFGPTFALGGGVCVSVWGQLHGCESGNLLQTHRDLWARKGSPCEVPGTSKGTRLLEGAKPAMISTISYEQASPSSLQTDRKCRAVNEVHSSCCGSAGRCLLVKQPKIHQWDSKRVGSPKIPIGLSTPASSLS